MNCLPGEDWCECAHPLVNLRCLIKALALKVGSNLVSLKEGRIFKRSVLVGGICITRNIPLKGNVRPWSFILSLLPGHEVSGFVLYKLLPRSSITSPKPWEQGIMNSNP